MKTYEIVPCNCDQTFFLNVPEDTKVEISNCPICGRTTGYTLVEGVEDGN